MFAEIVAGWLGGGVRVGFDSPSPSLSQKKQRKSLRKSRERVSEKEEKESPEKAEKEST
jgi:hypothetical protein